VITSEGILR